MRWATSPAKFGIFLTFLYFLGLLVGSLSRFAMQLMREHVEKCVIRCQVSFYLWRTFFVVSCYLP